MHIWLINSAERLYFDTNNGRMLRMSLLASHLKKQGNKVTYFTSGFNHVEKKHVVSSTITEIKEGLKITRLKAKGYQKHISFKRLIDHFFVGYEFWNHSKTLQKPDLIIASYPTIELCFFATKYAKINNIPIIVDVRDLWPDVFHEAMPNKYKFLVKLLVLPYQLINKTILKRATVITSISDGLLKWAHDKVSFKSKENFLSIPFCYDENVKNEPTANQIENIASTINFKADKDFIVTFVGSLSKSLDLSSIIQAASILEKSNTRVKFLVLGDGDMRKNYQSQAQKLSNIFFFGWVNDATVRKVLEMSDYGINPMPNRFDFLHTFNNKFSEYLANGVPVLVSPSVSDMARFVESNKCGYPFDLKRPQEIAVLIQRLSQEDSLGTSQMKKRCKDIFIKHFSSKIVLEKWDTAIAVATKI